MGRVHVIKSPLILKMAVNEITKARLARLAQDGFRTRKAVSEQSNNTHTIHIKCNEPSTIYDAMSKNILTTTLE